MTSEEVKQFLKEQEEFHERTRLRVLRKNKIKEHKKRIRENMKYRS